MTFHIHLVAGARPNVMKIGPLYHALAKEAWADPVIVHTGQHSAAVMSDTLFADFGLPRPHVQMHAAGPSHATATAAVMVAYEELCQSQRPDLVVVVGDVNSTVAATLAAKKLDLPVAHLEAGLRSFDRTMPEEINRIVTDSISDILWTPSDDADANLLREGASPERIVRVGNIMIDAYEMCATKIQAEAVHRSLGLTAGAYGVVTLHRPSNVDDPRTLAEIVARLDAVSNDIPLVFPVHPRTRGHLARIRLADAGGNLHLIDPLGYIRFMSLIVDSALVITDSGGIQEETSYLGIPCMTLRPSTERPITVTAGTNRLVRPEQLEATVAEILGSGRVERPSIPLWDGRTAERIVQHIRALAT